MHTTPSVSARSHRPRSYTVFGAAFVAGAAAAFGVNSVLDAHLAQARPQVESESILVAIRSLPAGAPVTVWDVALRDWPKAMVPSSAMRVTDDLENLVARHPLREGQPVLAVQLARIDAGESVAGKPVEVVSTALTGQAAPERDLWDPGSPAPRDPRVARPPARAETPATVVASAAPVVDRSASVATVTVASLPAAPVTPPPSPPPVTPPAPVTPPPTDSVARATDVAPTDVETLTLPNVAADGPAVATTPIETSSSAAPGVPTEREPQDASEPTAVARVEQPAATATDTPPSTRRAEEPPRTAQRPQPSAVQFLSVPQPESLEADAAPPLPDEDSTAWVAATPEPETAAAGESKPATGSAGTRGGTRNASAATPRSARAPAQPQRQQPPTRKPRSQRTANETRGYRPY